MQASNSSCAYSNEIVVSQVVFSIKKFANKGDKNYDYLERLIPVFLESALKKVSFFTVTEDQKEQLVSIVSLDDYLNRFKGGSPINRSIAFIKPKLKPVVFRNRVGPDPFSMIFFGEFLVRNNKVFIDIFKSSRYIEFDKTPYKIEASLDDLLQNPEPFFLGYAKSILNYCVYTASIQVEPKDSVVAIDDSVLGVGDVNEFLLTAGSHKLHVHRDGFKDYNDVITITKDGFHRTIELKRLTYKKHLRIVSKPTGAEVYVNEDFKGMTPLLINVQTDNAIITVSKKGYIDSVLYPFQYYDKNEVSVKLRVSNEIQKEKILAESYKRKSKIMYYSGLGFLATTILMAAEATVYKQEAELYRDSDAERYKKAIDKKNIYSSLATVAALSSGIVLTLSFKDILKYFKKYESGD